MWEYGGERESKRGIEKKRGEIGRKEEKREEKARRKGKHQAADNLRGGKMYIAAIKFFFPTKGRPRPPTANSTVSRFLALMQLERSGRWSGDVVGPRHNSSKTPPVEELTRTKRKEQRNISIKQKKTSQFLHGSSQNYAVLMHLAYHYVKNAQLYSSNSIG